MNFRTQVELPKRETEIRHSDRIMLFGSCFAENIGNLLLANKFRCDVNPFGILYNPLSIVEALWQILSHQTYTEEDLFYANAANKVYEYNGVILYFIKRDYTDSSPKYIYMPMHVPIEKNDVGAWIDAQKQAIKEEYVLFKRIYWYCETFSCVLVHRNREWFAAAVPKVRNVWSIIETERAMGGGCETRQPKKKTVVATGPKCLIKLDGL